MTAWDYDENGCGYSAPTKDYPYLYFPFIDVGAVSSASKNPSASSVSDILKYGACVRECPGADLTQPVDCKPPTFMTKDTAHYKNCVYYATSAKLKPMRYETAKLGRFCAPAGKALEQEALAGFEAAFNKYFGRFNIQSYISDIVAAREILYWTLLTGFLIGFIYLIFLRLFGGPIVYLSILAIILGTAYGGLMVYQSWQAMQPTHPHYKYY